MHVHIIDNDHFVMLFSNNRVSLVCAFARGRYIITGCYYCSSISSPGGDNLFFPDSAGPHFPPSHSSTPTSPFPSTVIPDENVLLEAVTNELGVDSIDPSLLNMSDLLSLLQPDSDPLDQLALTTEEASSDMIVLQQSDGMNVVQNLDLNINEEELLEGLPQELRDSVQAMLEDQ